MTTIYPALQVKIKKLHPEAVIPVYATEGAAGFDFVCLHDININPFQTVAVPTGLAMEVPRGFEIQVRPRSGISLKTGIRVANAPGTIDSDYRGEVKIILENTSNVVWSAKAGTRIAQGVLCPVFAAVWHETEDLEETQRADGGFGSTDSK
jgi:dUTP pyrophosphatase